MSPGGGRRSTGTVPKYSSRSSQGKNPHVEDLANNLTSQLSTSKNLQKGAPPVYDLPPPNSTSTDSSSLGSPVHQRSFRSTSSQQTHHTSTPRDRILRMYADEQSDLESGEEGPECDNKSSTPNTVPDINKVLNRLTQIRDCVAQTDVIMDNLKASPDPDNGQLERCLMVKRHFEAQEQDYLSLLHSLVNVTDATESLQGQRAQMELLRTQQGHTRHGQPPGDTRQVQQPDTGAEVENAASGEDTASLLEKRRELIKKVSESQQKLHELQEQQEILKNLKKQAKIHVQQRQDASSVSRMREEDSPSSTALSITDLTTGLEEELDNLQARLLAVDELSQQNENVGPSNYWIPQELHGKLLDLQEKKKEMDELLRALQNLRQTRESHQNSAGAQNSQDYMKNMKIKADELMNSDINKKYKQIRAMKSRLSQIQNLMASFQDGVQEAARMSGPLDGQEVTVGLNPPPQTETYASHDEDSSDDERIEKVLDTRTKLNQLQELLKCVHDNQNAGIPIHSGLNLTQLQLLREVQDDMHSQSTSREGSHANHENNEVVVQKPSNVPRQDHILEEQFNSVQGQIKDLQKKHDTLALVTSQLQKFQQNFTRNQVTNMDVKGKSKAADKKGRDRTLLQNQGLSERHRLHLDLRHHQRALEEYMRKESTSNFPQYQDNLSCDNISVKSERYSPTYPATELTTTNATWGGSTQENTDFADTENHEAQTFMGGDDLNQQTAGGDVEHRLNRSTNSFSQHEHTAERRLRNQPAGMDRDVWTRKGVGTPKAGWLTHDTLQPTADNLDVSDHSFLRWPQQQFLQQQQLDSPGSSHNVIPDPSNLYQLVPPYSGPPVPPRFDGVQLYTLQLQQQQMMISLNACFQALSLQQRELASLQMNVAQLLSNPSDEGSSSQLHNNFVEGVAPQTGFPSLQQFRHSFTFPPPSSQVGAFASSPNEDSQVLPSPSHANAAQSLPNLLSVPQNAFPASATAFRPTSIPEVAVPPASMDSNFVSDEWNNDPGSASASHTTTLNNQVVPGVRANNYWDNFRSYTRQNLLSGSTRKRNDTHSQQTSESATVQTDDWRDVTRNTGPGVISKRKMNRTEQRHNSMKPAHADNRALASAAASGIQSPGIPNSSLSINPPTNVISPSASQQPHPQASMSDILPVSSAASLSATSSATSSTISVRDGDRVAAPVTSVAMNSNPPSSSTRSSDVLPESIYAEMSSFISMNESHPEFLHELFRDLKMLQSDYQRQKALCSLHSALSQTETENQTQTSREIQGRFFAESPEGAAAQSMNMPLQNSSREKSRSTEDLMPDLPKNVARNQNLHDGGLVDLSADFPVNQTHSLNNQIHTVLQACRPFLNMHQEELCTSSLLSGLSHIVMLALSDIAPGSSKSLLENINTTLQKHFTGRRLKDSFEDIVRMISDILFLNQLSLRDLQQSPAMNQTSAGNEVNFVFEPFGEADSVADIHQTSAFDASCPPIPAGGRVLIHKKGRLMYPRSPVSVLDCDTEIEAMNSTQHLAEADQSQDSPRDLPQDDMMLPELSNMILQEHNGLHGEGALSDDITDNNSEVKPSDETEDDFLLFSEDAEGAVGFTNHTSQMISPECEQVEQELELDQIPTKLSTAESEALDEMPNSFVNEILSNENVEAELVGSEILSNESVEAELASSHALPPS